MIGAANGKYSEEKSSDIDLWPNKKPLSADADRGFRSSDELFHFTLAKIITRVYSASDSISARPKISAS